MVLYTQRLQTNLGSLQTTTIKKLRQLRRLSNLFTLESPAAPAGVGRRVGLQKLRSSRAGLEGFSQEESGGLTRPVGLRRCRNCCCPPLGNTARVGLDIGTARGESCIPEPLSVCSKFARLQCIGKCRVLCIEKDTKSAAVLSAPGALQYVQHAQLKAAAADLSAGVIAEYCCRASSALVVECSAVAGILLLSSVPGRCESWADSVP